jgi:hypothetical protein
MKKSIEMSIELAKELLNTNPALDAAIKSKFTDKELGLINHTRITSIKDAFLNNGIKEKDFAEKTQFDSPDEKAFKEIKQFSIAVNPVGWEPDYEDGDQEKHFPVFQFSKSGFGFYDTYYDYDYTRTYLGSRPYATAELAEYAGKTILSTYKSLYTNK